MTEADAALYVTLVRFDLLYSRYLGPVKYRAGSEKCFGLLKRSVTHSAFAHHTDFAASRRQEELRRERRLPRQHTLRSGTSED